MGGVGLLEYFTHPEGVLLLVLTSGESAPVLAEVGPAADGQLITAGALHDRVTRLLVDVHGLPPGWDAAYWGDRYIRALRLPPAVNAAKRSGPLLRRKLHNPKFHYGTDYLDNIGPSLLPVSVRPMLADCDVLCVVPHGPLHSIPFAVLRWDAESLVGERFGLCQVPSASLLPLLQDRNPARRSGPARARSCLAAAIAAAEDADPGEFEADAVLLSAVLKDAGGSIACLVGARGPTAATKDAVTAAAPSHDIVHLACHGVFLEYVADAMEGTGLLLSDGYDAPALSLFTGAEEISAPARRHLLSAREVLSLSLNAELVTLRACSSGRSTVEPGDELLGLVRAFLHAGTSSILASLWNVNKASSRLLLEHFYRTWLSENRVPKWRALQEAQRLLRDTPDYDHPFHWAPFTLIGDWL